MRHEGLDRMDGVALENYVVRDMITHFEVPSTYIYLYNIQNSKEPRMHFLHPTTHI